MTVTRALVLSLLALPICACGPSGKLIHDRHSMSRLYVPDDGDRIVFEASVSPDYPAQGEEAEAARMLWIKQWLKQRNLCANGFEIEERTKIGSAADNPYHHDLRYTLRCIPLQ